MRIARVEVIPLSLPFVEPYITASGELEGRAMVLLRLHSGGGGPVGLGEAVPMSLRGGATMGQVVSELAELCGPALSGADITGLAEPDPREVRATIWELLGRCRLQRVSTPALCAIDIALHDLAGKLTGLPTWRLLGPTTAREVRCNATLDASDAESVADRALGLRARGFQTFKVKVGRGDDLARVTALREAVAEDARIRIDANQAWQPEEATERLRELQVCGLELAEQPTAGLEGLAHVRARTPVPVVADESVSSAPEATAAVQHRSCDATTIKLSKVGGILEAIRISSILPGFMSSALDGPIGIAAAIHTVQALPRSGYAADLAHGLATLDMFGDSYAPSTGLCASMVVPPRAPGIGVSIDEDALSRLRL